MVGAADMQHGAEQRLGPGVLVVLLVVASGFWVAMGWLAAIAHLFGVLIVIAIGRLQRWQLQRAARLAGNDPAKNLRYLYRCAAERFIATVVLFAAGLGLMAMPPLPMLSGFVIAQGAMIYRFYQVSSMRRRHG